MDDQFLQATDFIIKMTIIRSPGVDAADGMHHGRMVPSAEVSTDLPETESGVLPRQIHPDLPGQGDGLVASLGKQVGDSETVVVADRVEDVLDRGGTSRCGDLLFTDRSFAQIHADGGLLQKREALKLGDGTLQLPDVRIQPGGDVRRTIVRKIDIPHFSLAPDDRHPGFVAGPLDIGDQSTVEPAGQTLLEIGDFVRGRIGTEHDLPSGLIQTVEGVEEFLLRRTTLGQIVDVVDDQQRAMRLGDIGDPAQPLGRRGVEPAFALHGFDKDRRRRVEPAAAGSSPEP